MSKQCSDHLGNTFSSKKEMCTYWKIPPGTYTERLRRGWSVEKALTTPVPDCSCMDHLGNTFPSLMQMCAYWNIPYKTFVGRKRRGWSVKKALTKPVRKKNA